jgi:hypothetical protein
MGDCGSEGGIERMGESLVLGMLSRRSWSWLYRWVVRFWRAHESCDEVVSRLLISERYHACLQLLSSHTGDMCRRL